MKEKEKSYQWKYKLVIILILLLLIIIIGWLIFRGRQELADKQPVGNTDIFEIDCDCDKEEEPSPSEDVDATFEETDEKKNSGQSDSSSTPKLVVADTEQQWSTTNQLRIFKNPVYDMEEIIAPGSSNSYRFVIKNPSDCNMTYRLEFYEDNPYQIHMQYRLKKNGQYIVNWSDYTQLQVATSKLKNKKQDDYVLEWKWVESDNDTMIGANVDSTYHLSVFIVGNKIN